RPLEAAPRGVSSRPGRPVRPARLGVFRRL
ncbi:MAG: hypothetical protein AVDCRST_MAG70-2374, partial [uncultured Thermomicrobiales bacterium]